MPSAPTLSPPVGEPPPDTRAASGTPRVPTWVGLTWSGFVVAALVALDLWDLATWGWAVPLAATALAVTMASSAHGVDWVRRRPDRADLAAVAGLYVAVVGLFRLAFVGFGTGRVLGLFLSFGGGLLVGVVGPIVYTVWGRRRPLRALGLGTHAIRTTILLGLVFAAVQFAMTLGRISLPAPGDWVPLLVMSLTVGLFEAVFFRGFVQGRLRESFGTGPSVLGAASLYSAYHVGYGMGSEELLFLFGLGVVYAIAYRLADNVLVLWPLLTPVGAFFNNLRAGDIELPWASIVGFGEVLALMAVAVWLGARHTRPTARLDHTPHDGRPT